MIVIRVTKKEHLLNSLENSFLWVKETHLPEVNPLGKVGGVNK